MRLIDAERLVIHLSDYALQESPGWGANGWGNQDAYDAISNCILAVQEAPTVEAVAVVKPRRADAGQPVRRIRRRINMGWRPAISKAPASEWIPCTVRMPESGSYLVTKRQATGELQVAIGNYYASGNQWSGNGNFKNVIAWMPLPGPWEEGDE